MRKSQYRPEKNDKADFTWNRVITGGWNTGFTAEVYAQINGYDPTMRTGEDMFIGQSISVLRGTKKPDGSVTPNTSTIETVKSRTDSSPRRFLMAFTLGIGPYDKFGNYQEEKNLRGKSLDELLDGIKDMENLNDTNKSRLEKELSGLATFMKDTTPDEPSLLNSFGKVMFFLGFRKGDYRIETQTDGTYNVIIDNIINVKNALEEYKRNPKYKKRYERQDNYGK